MSRGPKVLKIEKALDQTLATLHTVARQHCIGMGTGRSTRNLDTFRFIA